MRDWLRELDKVDRNVLGLDLMRLQTRWPLGMPHCRPLGAGLWELRSSLPGGRIARVMFFVEEGRIGIVHALMKKTQALPGEALELARKRMREMQLE